MSWEEFRTRMAQAAVKRLDYATCRLGLRPAAPVIAPCLEQTKFFFRNDTDEAAQRAALIRQRLPQEADSILHEADHICRHEFSLLGYERVSYGSTIDWQSDPIHGKRAPLAPWYRINFLDFNAVGDHKIVWELNRHQHLITLAKAWLLTGNRTFTDELQNQWYAWREANPYPFGINWASTLEVAFRSLSWLWVRNLLGRCPDIRPNFQNDLLQQLQIHGRYIERFLSTYFSPNTHLLGEAVALFFIGNLCPELSAAERWRNNGWRIVLEEAERQVRTDGVYFEQSLYYHVYALDFFLHVRLLASANGMAIPEAFDTTIKKMLCVVEGLSAGGAVEGFGDDDGGRVFNPRRNRVEHMSDPLALGLVAYGCATCPSARLTEEAIWIFGQKAIDVTGKTTPQLAPAGSKAFPEGGVYLIYDDKPCAQRMMIDCGPQGTGRSGHGHADALSIRLSINEARVLIDSGTYTYVSDPQERNRVRGTGAHNTVTIDDFDQAIPDGPFAWGGIPRVKKTVWVSGNSFTYFEGFHDGYNRLADPVLHRRSVFHVAGGLWFVRDVLEGKDIHLIENFWHFAPDVKVQHKNGVVIAQSTPASARKPSGITLFMDQSSAWKIETVEGSVSPVYGLKEVAPVVQVSARIKLPAECAILLLPIAITEEIGKLDQIDGDSSQNLKEYYYAAGDSTEYLFFAAGDASWVGERWSSDARMLYCKLKGEKLEHVIMINGSFAKWAGKTLVQLQKAATYEWRQAQDNGGMIEDLVMVT
jgi:hypothetical protein